MIGSPIPSPRWLRPLLLTVLAAVFTPAFAQPSPTWNLTGGDAQQIAADCVGTSYFGVADSGDGCQEYANDIYENWNPAVSGHGDADILAFSVGSDASFFYFEWETRESWNYTSQGESRKYLLEIDVDYGTETDRGDFLLKYEPQTDHLGNGWQVGDQGGTGKVIGFRDTNDDVGGPNPLLSDFDCATCDGYDDSFDTNNEIYHRVINRGGKNIPQLAVVRTAFSGPPRPCAREAGSARRATSRRPNSPGTTSWARTT